MKKVIASIICIMVVFGTVILPSSASANEVFGKVGLVTTNSTRLMVRKSSSAKSDVVYALNKGSYVTLIEHNNGWWKVEYLEGQFGYCKDDYISEVSVTYAKVNLNSGSLNIREGAGTNYKSIGYLKNGNTVTVLSSSNGWSKIIFNGTKIGYVSEKYLTEIFQAIKLNVPNFKQNDNRWANVKIGNSGKTIAQIGCVTTALAMTESVRLNTTIYPDAMTKRLNYTQSGNVYWPSNYKTVLSNSNYLEKIYELLKSGKPIVFGSKNRSGGQHWLVITGFKGGSTLSAANFTVNDPGSNKITTLQQHLNSHPIFYKFLYY